MISLNKKYAGKENYLEIIQKSYVRGSGLSGNKLPCMVLGTQVTIETCLPLVHFQPASSEVDSQIGHNKVLSAKYL